MSHLILIRHSLSRQQPNVSAHEWTLTEEGIQRCERLAAYIRPYNVSRFWSSPEPKAYLTAQRTAQILNVSQLEISADLREQTRNTAPYYQNVGDFEAAVIAAMREPDMLLFGEETFTAARERLANALDTIMTEAGDATVAAVSHGTVMALWLAGIMQQPAEHIWQAMGMPAYFVIAWPQKQVLHFEHEVK